VRLMLWAFSGHLSTPIGGRSRRTKASKQKNPLFVLLRGADAAAHGKVIAPIHAFGPVGSFVTRSRSELLDYSIRWRSIANSTVPRGLFCLSAIRLPANLERSRTRSVPKAMDIAD
jgi:hypothetical protein